MWYADQRYWVIIVEFQPSGWAKGSYLSTGVNWLWSGHEGYSIHDRPVDFVPFESAEQFSPLIERMAMRAAQEVEALRERFRSMNHIYRHLIADAGRDHWASYYAAVAAGLVGEMAISSQLFQRLEEWTPYEEPSQLKSSSSTLNTLLPDSAKFRSNVLQIIEHTRSLMKLPPDSSCLESIYFQAER